MSHTDTRLLRSLVREVVLTESKVRLPSRRRIRESFYSSGDLVFYSPVHGIMTEWDLALAYTKGGAILNETLSNRGRRLVENIVQGFANAIRWTGRAIGRGAKAVLKAGGEELAAAGKCLMSLLEKIPGGKDAFEFLKDFTTEAADKIKGYVSEAAKEFGTFLTDNRDKILGTIFEAGSSDNGVVAKLKELIEKGKKDFGDQMDKVKEFFNDFKTNPVEAAKKFFSLRKILGSIISGVVSMILKKSEGIAKKIIGVFDSAGFTKSKLGMFFLRIITFFSTDMGGEEVLEAAGKMWTSAKKLRSDKMDIENRTRSLLDVIPKIVKGLIGGGSSLEAVIRSAAGDPQAITDLFANATKMISKALEKMVGSGAEKVVKSLGFDPEGMMGKKVISAMQGLVGLEPEEVS